MCGTVVRVSDSMRVCRCECAGVVWCEVTLGSRPSEPLTNTNPLALVA